MVAYSISAPIIRFAHMASPMAFTYALINLRIMMLGQLRTITRGKVILSRILPKIP